MAPNYRPTQSRAPEARARYGPSPTSLAVAPAQAKPQNSFLIDFLGAMAQDSAAARTAGGKGVRDAAEIRVDNANAEKTEMESRQLKAREAAAMVLGGQYDPTTGQQSPGLLAAFEDPEMAGGRGAGLANVAARFGMSTEDIEALARGQQLSAGLRSPTTLANAFIPGQSQEQSVVYAGAAAGEGPLAPGAAYDVNRSQGNVLLEDATKRYDTDVDARTNLGVAGINARSAREVANIRETGETARSQNSLTEAFNTPTIKPEDLDVAIETAVETAGLPTDSLSLARIKTRTQELYQAGNELTTSIQQAIQELRVEQPRAPFLGIIPRGNETVINPEAPIRAVPRATNTRRKTAYGEGDAPAPAGGPASPGGGRPRTRFPRANEPQGAVVTHRYNTETGRVEAVR